MSAVLVVAWSFSWEFAMLIQYFNLLEGISKMSESIVHESIKLTIFSSIWIGDPMILWALTGWLETILWDSERLFGYIVYVILNGYCKILCDVERWFSLFTCIYSILKGGLNAWILTYVEMMPNSWMLLDKIGWIVASLALPWITHSWNYPVPRDPNNG